MAPITIEPSLYADGCQETELHECPPIGVHFAAAKQTAIRFYPSGKETRLFKCRSHPSHAAEPRRKLNKKN